MASLYDFYMQWFPGEVNHLDGFHRHVAARLPVTGKILDVGCGSNDLLARYRSVDREVWGVDFAAHPTLQHADWFRGLHPDGRIPFPDGEFDVVTSFMVMEHVASPAAFMAEIARVLKPGGLYIGQSIHSLHYVTWIRRMFDVLPHGVVQRLVKQLYGREEHDTFPTCYRLNRRGSIAKASRPANLEWDAWHTYASPSYFDFSPLLWRLAVITDWTLEKTYAGLGRLYFTAILRKPRQLSETAASACLGRAA